MTGVQTCALPICLFILLLFLFLFVLKWIFSCSVPTNPFNLRFCALNLLGLCILLLLSGTARDAGGRYGVEEGVGLRLMCLELSQVVYFIFLLLVGGMGLKKRWV